MTPRHSPQTIDRRLLTAAGKCHGDQGVDPGEPHYVSVSNYSSDRTLAELLKSASSWFYFDSLFTHRFGHRSHACNSTSSRDQQVAFSFIS